MSWLNLIGRKAIVTGAASGIGAAVCKALTAAKCDVVLVDVNEDALEQTATECNKQLNQRPDDKDDCVSTTIPHVCNVSQEEEVQQLFQEETLGNNPACPSILVNCAGITRDGWISKLNVKEHWDPVQDVNLKGTWLMCREFIKHHQKVAKDETSSALELSRSSTNDRASIINISSIVAIQGNLGQSNYAASKGGVLGLTRALAKEVAPFSIRVNAIAPGFINTDMTRAVPPPVLQSIQARIPLGRMGDPEEVADLVLFLASERSRYITGETIECSGMLTL